MSSLNLGVAQSKKLSDYFRLGCFRKCLDFRLCLGPKKMPPSAPEISFWSRNNYVHAPIIWAMCFLQNKKNASNLVKCGLHSRTYYLHPHVGSHSVLYFTTLATEKYSDSNVLGIELLGQLKISHQVSANLGFCKLRSASTPGLGDWFRNAGN